jgi:hypothetical protein
VFYLPQTVSYYTASGAWFFQAGFNVTVSMSGASGTWVFNVLAIRLGLGHILAAELTSARADRPPAVLAGSLRASRGLRRPLMHNVGQHGEFA